MCLTPLFINGFSVPCGKCDECIIDRIESWKFRLQEEQKNHVHSTFVTLTKDDENCDGNVYKEDLQKFFKRLRHDIDFKYYAISEYGPHTFRPHYHVIMFHDVELGKFYDLIEHHWKQGNIKIGELTIGRVSYCASYHITKNIHPKDTELPFVLMSKGLGISYLTGALYRFHKMTGNSSAKLDSYKIALPRYYKKKLHFTKEKKDIAKDYAAKKSLIDSERAIKAHNLKEKVQRILNKKRHV